MTGRAKGTATRLAVVGLVGLVVTRASAAEIAWPTPNRAAVEGRPYAEFVQPTESGLVESGMFGCVRTSGQQFHEGLDLFPLRRDKRGEPVDAVFAILPGIVRYVNDVPGRSNYGRYVVLEHEERGLGFISLYAHLAGVASGVSAGTRVEAGQTLGLMGHSASTGIPRERAHLHLEIGFWLNRGFQRWYDTKGYSSRNEHGMFNGGNVTGFDFLDFFERHRAGDVRDVRDYVARLPAAVTVVVRQAAIPDFVARHPALQRTALPVGGVAAWRIEFTWYGLPKAWWPLDATAAESLATAGKDATIEIVGHDRALLERFPCRDLVRVSGGRVTPGATLLDAISLLFTAP